MMAASSTPMTWGFAMARLLAGLVVTVGLVLVPALPATAAPAVTVDVRASHVTLNADGTVSVPLRVRCSPPLDAFEVGVGVRQGGIVGGAFVLGGTFPACTGKWQKATFTVTAESGAFVSGTATVSGYVALYDSVQDEDVFAEDSATARL
jgi:hypothetical protein